MKQYTRKGQNPSLLDCIFTEDESDIDEVTSLWARAITSHYVASAAWMEMNADRSWKRNYWIGDYEGICRGPDLIDWKRQLRGKDRRCIEMLCNPAL